MKSAVRRAGMWAGSLGRKRLAGPTGGYVSKRGKVLPNPAAVRKSGYRRMGAVGGGMAMMSSRDSSARRGRPQARSSGGRM